MTVYGDILFTVNAVPDFLLLLLGAKLCGYPLRRWRAALAAALGGLYAVAVVLPVPLFFRSVFGRMLCFLAMAAIAYGVRPRALRPAALMILCGAALAGIVYAIVQSEVLELVTLRGESIYPISARMLILLAGVFYLAAALLAAGAMRHGSREQTAIRITLGNRTVSVTALRDTGNTLSDPLTGEPVIVLAPQRGRELLGAELPGEDAAAWIASHPSLKARLVPYRAVGVQRGFLAAIPCRVKIGEKKEHTALVAVSPTPVSDGGSYEALIGGIAS
ncbi:MAG: sigma-E processing peptidase SpoIIGA [Oscillospiraceae bacterium]|nr:sigma-E processing peptidase SpoIIGA [Oscillospiraceae bacterium]